MLTIYTLALTAALQATPTHQAVRTDEPSLRSALDRGIERSQTLAKLVTALDASDVIVYMERKVRMPSGLQAFLAHQIAKVGTHRVLRIVASVDLHGDTLISILAHELQHALEVADAPTVRSDHALSVMFRDTKRQCQVCETERAQQIQELVLRELKAAR